MQIKSVYKRIDSWMRNISTIQYALLTWLIAFSSSVLVGLAFPGNSLVNAATYAAGQLLGLRLSFTLRGCQMADTADFTVPIREYPLSHVT